MSLPPEEPKSEIEAILRDYTPDFNHIDHTDCAEATQAKDCLANIQALIDKAYKNGWQDAMHQEHPPETNSESGR